MIRTIDRIIESPLDLDRTVGEQAGFGALETERGCLPLVALDVLASLHGLASQVTVRQTFRNALDEPLEATYVFPLPDRAAVTSFRMKVADRVVEGQLKERARARADYRRAIEAGHRAAIAEEERSGTFNLRVGNIPPGEEVSVELTLVGPLPVSAGEATFRFPLVVAPRYVPGVALDGPSVGPGWGHDTDQVPDASRVTPPVLLPGFPNPVRLSLEVKLDPAGLEGSTDDWADAIRSSLHSVIADEGPPWTIRLQPGERLDRDFILRFPVAAAAVGSVLQASAAGEGKPGTFALTLVPPALTRQSGPKPRDVVFVLDRSGSMTGWKMVAARRAVGRMIDSLMDHDRFTVLAFDNTIERPAHAEAGWVRATDRNRWQTLEWLGRIDARGGTEMGPALVEAVRSLAGVDASRESILVLITDGQVAGEDSVLRSLSKAAKDALPRIYTLGIDRAVNAGFLRRLADRGRGDCDLVESESRLDAAMSRFHRAIGSPVLTDLRLEPVGFRCVDDSLAPSPLPDVFPDRPITVFGRHRGAHDSIRLRIHATDCDGRPWSTEVTGRSGPAEALMSQWGRAKVRELEDRYAGGLDRDPEALSKRIVEVSLEAHVLSRFTAYVAVDTAEVVNEGGRQQEIVQPVDMPAGWEMVDEASLLSQTMCFTEDTGARAARVRGESAAAVSPFVMRTKQSLGRTRPALTLTDTLDPAREALEDLARRKWPRTRCKSLHRLIACLERLLYVLERGGHPAEPAVDEAIKHARELLDAYAAGNKEALGGERFNELLEKVRAALDAITGPPEPPRREEFWT
ncbi:MAG: VIT domain-containing protein [Planctomycetota bacterium]|jgi:Ca-activated chloride channel family protein